MKARWVWGLALGCFVLAAGTGAYYRLKLVYPLPGVLEYVRHAHSHLMFFSWVTPVLVLLVGAYLAREGMRPRLFGFTAALAAFSGLATYLPFLKSGYHLMVVGSKALPISMMVSGGNGVAWYLFVVAYVVATWRVRRRPELRLLDGAVAMIVISTVAIGGLAYLGMSGQVARPLMLALVDWFLTCFADGWFGLAVLALAARHAPSAGLSRTPVGLLTWALVASIGVRSAARFGTDGLGWQWPAGFDAVASAVAALAWLLLVRAVWPVAAKAGLRGSTSWLRQLALALIALKGTVELAGALPAVRAELMAAPFHVFFLHAFLLGAVSFALVYGVRTTIGPTAFKGATAFIVAVGVMVGTLVTLTPVWPSALSGPWVLYATAVTSLGPLLVALQALLRLDLGSGSRARRPRAAARR